MRHAQIFRGGGLIESVCQCVYVYLEGRGGGGVLEEKGGQLSWKLSLPCAFAPFILGSKRCVRLPVRVNVSEHLCVFVEEPHRFQSPRDKTAEIFIIFPILHIYSIGREEKPWCVLSAVVINSLETSLSPVDFKEP